MQLTVKTLKGGKFPVNAEPSNTVLEVKGIIVRLHRSCDSFVGSEYSTASRCANPHDLAAHGTLYR